MSRKTQSIEATGNSIHVLGTVRNGDKSLRHAVKDIQRFVGDRRVNNWFFVESDSDDGTLDTLRGISSQVAEFHFESLGSLSKTIPSRVHRISISRQRALDLVSEILKPDDVVIVADLDGLTSPLKNGDLQRVERFFNRFDVITANSQVRYFDILALRASGWVDEDYRVTRRRLVEGGATPIAAHFESLVKKQVRISQKSRVIEVESAFGGLAVYSGRAFLSGSYLMGDLEECEHVRFHRQLVEKGFKICIDPNLIVSPERVHIALSSPLLRLPWRLLIRRQSYIPSPFIKAIERRIQA
jgi:hypothetical protein